MQSLEVEGRFWLPRQPDKKVSGRLRFSVEDGGELSLIGGLANFAISSSPRIEPFRILGSSGNQLYTLDDCLLGTTSGAFLDIVKQEFHVGRVIVGAEYDQDEPLEFDEIRVEFTDLIRWVRLSGFSQSMEYQEGDEGGARITVTSDPVDSLPVELPSGVLKLEQRRGIAGDGLTIRSLTQYVSFQMKFRQIRPLVDAIDVMSDLQDLVSIGLDRSAPFEDIQLRHPDLFIETADGARYPKSVHFLAQWNAQPKPASKPPTDYDMAFTLSDLEGMDGIARWLEQAEKYRAELGRVMATRYAKRMYMDDLFLNRVAALEGFHRAWTGTTRRTALRMRLTDLATLAGRPFEQLVGDTDRWCKVAKDERDNIAHHFGRRLHQRGRYLYYHGQASYWLFVLCMLSVSRAPDAVFEHIIRCPSFVWTAERIAELQ